jgi:hypothetical protein
MHIQIVSVILTITPSRVQSLRWLEVDMTREEILKKIADLWVIINAARDEQKKYHIRHDSREVFKCLIKMEKLEDALLTSTET